jgi:hypothetical protein
MHCKTMGAPEWYCSGSPPTVVYKAMRKLIKWQNKELKKAQTNNSVCLPEMNTMIKSIYRTPCSIDTTTSYPDRRK